MFKKLFALAAVCTVLSAGVLVYHLNAEDIEEGGIVTIGSSGPLRYLSCFDVYDQIAEVDKGDVTDAKNGRAYSYAYDYSTLDYHPDNALDPATAEKIINRKPDLIVIQETIWNGYKNLCESLDKHFEVVVVPDQNMSEMWDQDYELAPEIKEAFRSLGAALGKEERAEELINGINDVFSDIRSLAGGATDDKVYVAGVTIQGTNNLVTTFPAYLPLMLVGGFNAYQKQAGDGDKVVLSAEHVYEMDFSTVVIDPSSSDKILVKESQDLLKLIFAGDKNVSMYVTSPIVWDNINYDCVLVSSYYLLHLLYGTLTVSEVIEKANAVFELFYGEKGKSVLNDMGSFFEEKSYGNGQELPLFGKVEVVRNGETYGIKAAAV